jgi:hypothetical protein
MLPVASNRPTGENSPNLVTLFQTAILSLFSANFNDLTQFSAILRDFTQFYAILRDFTQFCTILRNFHNFTHGKN